MKRLVFNTGVFILKLFRDVEFLDRNFPSDIKMQVARIKCVSWIRVSFILITVDLLHTTV